MPSRNPVRATARKELTPDIRSRICELRSINWSWKKIHERYPDIPLSTIRYTVKREEARNQNKSLPRTGRPRILTDEQRDHVYDIVTHKNPHISMPDLLAEVDNAVKLRSIRVLLREMDRRKWLQRRRPHLKPEHAAKRLRWAQQHEHWGPEDWKRVRWSDECTVERGYGIGAQYTFRRPSEQLEARDIYSLPLHKQVKQMFWAGFSYDMRTELVALQGDPDSARRGVSSRTIVNLYREVLQGFVNPQAGHIFMQDNAPVHNAHIVRNLLHDMGIRCMEWPPYSPDLNPIENLWKLLKRGIYKLRPDLLEAPNNDDTLEILVDTAKEAWKMLREEILQNLSVKMKNRVDAVLAADGWYTKY